MVSCLTSHEAELGGLLGEDKAGNVLLVEAHIPFDAHAFPGLGLLDALVVVSLCLHQRPKDILVDVCVLIPAQAG